MSKLHITLAALYLAAGVITFGHAAAQNEREITAKVAACEQRRPDTLCFGNPVAPAASGILAAMLWPLYWSWDAWR